MKNKKAAQIEAKRKHKAELTAAKARRRGEQILDRAAPTRKLKPTILIVCEGENTEPSYFRQFKLTSATIKAVGNGSNTVSLVQEAIKLTEKESFEQVWCVFDKDTFPAENFNKAILMAEARGINVAYSNQAFEYWLILHFEDHQGAKMNRAEYDETINQHLEEFGVKYDGEGSKKVSEEFFDVLMSTTEDGRKRIDLAITRAKRSYDHWDHKSPALEESTTTVFRLVEEILSFS
jgi:RloB-like protein